MSKKKTTKNVKPAKRAKSAKSVKAAKSKPPKLATSKQASAAAVSFAVSTPLFSSLDATPATAAAIRTVSLAKDNANVLVQVTTAGKIDAVPCTLNLPVGVFPLHYQAEGVGNFTVTVTGAELSHPIAGTAPDSGTLLIKVS